LAAVEIMARVECRRKWTADEKAILLAEVEAEGGRVTVVARRHRIAESVLYNWRAARKAATSINQQPEVSGFVPLGVYAGAAEQGPLMPALPARQRRTSYGDIGGGRIEIVLPNGAQLWVYALVNEQALARVLRAVKGAI